MNETEIRIWLDQVPEICILEMHYRLHRYLRNETNGRMRDHGRITGCPRNLNITNASPTI